MRPLCLVAVLPRLRVSIHAPREGCDGRGVGTQQGKEIVSIHAPREGCDSGGHDLGNINLSFNSRTPGGVRQQRQGSQYHIVLFQFTHPGRGATKAGILAGKDAPVSIHAPREGCDLRGES